MCWPASLKEVLVGKFFTDVIPALTVQTLSAVTKAERREHSNVTTVTP